MNRFSTRISLTGVSLLIFISPHIQCMLNNIVETDTILHDDYKYLSLVDGSLAWETGVIRRLYDLGQIFPVYKTDKRGRKIIENYEHSEQTDPMIRLIHAFFYRVPGSTGETDFGATIQLAVDDVTAVRLVANIIAQCEQLQQQYKQFQAATDYIKNLILIINDAGWLDKLGKKTTQAGLENKVKEIQEKPWNTNAETAFMSMCTAFAKQLAKDLPEEILHKLEEHKQMAEKFFSLIMAINNNLRTLFKPEVFKKREAVESFIPRAIGESDPNNPSALYLPHTVEMVLLAFVYKKFSSDRNILKAFYDELNMQLDGKVLVHALDEAWTKESFPSVTQVEALQHIKNILSAQNLMQSIKQNFAAFVYNSFQIRAFPAPVGYAKVVYEYEVGKKTPVFSDCMCNTMRNFINLYAYDAGKNQFTLEKLLANMNLSQVHPSLAMFLKDFNSVNKASSLDAHDAWLTVISHIPYVAYNQMVDGPTGQSMVATGKGYITIPENERTDESSNWFKNNGYQMLGKNQYGYELQPSIKNIIIVLNHLLQLHLFSGAHDLTKELMRSDFIAVYFPKLCAALKASDCFLTTQENANQNELDKNFDALDYTQDNVYMYFDLAKIKCKFTTYSGHGELRLTSAEGAQGEEVSFIRLLDKINDFADQPSLSLLVTNVIGKQGVWLRNHLNPKYLYINLFAMPLENTGLLTENSLNTIFSKITNDTPLLMKIRIKDLLLQLAERQPDDLQKHLLTLKILTLFVNRLSDKDVSSSDTTNLFKDIIQVAAKSMMHKELAVQGSALSLFRTLFKNNIGIDEATQIAQKGITDQKAMARKGALNLFNALIAQNQKFNEAAQAAEKGITDSSSVVRRFALYLFKTLVQKGHVFKEAMQAAINSITYQANVSDIADENIAHHLAQEAVHERVSAFELFEQLVLKVPNETKKAVQKILDDPNLTLPEDEKSGLSALLK